MSTETKKTLVEVLRENPGGLGESLTAQQKRAIITGIKNEPENIEPFNPDRFKEGLSRTFRNNPIEWVKF